ncbi:MAG: 2-oxo acid dehydrogenase subunit E2 [Methylococcaceae bacterium]|jgi:pyruvate dehydrogenase E2 component (dihydrolipoamide acetyltransferase)|nr:2-oxo acid dehydrogenase subunit E2 [Methylococcaceae bacterium]MDZ4155714.1 2-oxo acid dehydrogenase subunit E2 [Methylococcales bacterium]MDP2391937.1 2-oxo acid dehydrogenase subunit E2 [Methylococcaceae bacterium]MDP3018824.1 2-oxo acid dehydrogenase subunit E2 [Methylococcaceae bacterium]MDP3391385.1 2-oxo acid dehydrogenase subunit E2 [Methylococcaceae bacterium]
MALIEIKVPDVGTAEVDVVDVLIKAGDIIAAEQTLAVLETDKASMDLPSSAAGTVQEVFIKKGDKASEGTLIATLLVSDEAPAAPETAQPAAPANTTVAAQAPVAVPTAPTPKLPEPAPVSQGQGQSQSSDTGKAAHATPAVRLFARELGVDISGIKTGTGRKGRILKDDVKNFVKKAMTEGVNQVGGSIPSIPAVDFSQFGDTEERQLSKIKRLTGQNLSRVWLNLPLVTYHEEADITDQEAFRVALNAEKAAGEVKITGLIFIIKALVAAMQQFPQFNASLSPDGEKLILKKYFNIGIAVDTPNGLVVPVLRDVNNKGINEIAVELAEKSEKARLGKLSPADMQGGCLTISSLGGIGGTAFTPIVNAPEVAILGVTRAKMQPVWNGKEFIPRLMLPLDLTYDHRVIDGAEGARFMAVVKQNLSDIRRLLL